MNAIVIKPSVSKRKKIAEYLIEMMKIWLVIKPLQIAFARKNAHKTNLLKASPENSVGKDIAHLLELHNLHLIPFYEDHDLKHLILGYGMSSEEEVRMQVYLLGNGNRSLSCVLFVLSGLLIPSSWNLFYQDYLAGKNAPSILDLTLDYCLHQTTAELKERYSRFQNRTEVLFTYK